MSLSRKHYIKAAKTISVLHDSLKDTVVRTFMDIFKEDNKRFDQWKFLKACGYKESEIESKFGLGMNESRSFDKMNQQGIVTTPSVGVTSQTSAGLKLRNAMPTLTEAPKKMKTSAEVAEDLRYWWEQIDTYHIPDLRDEIGKFIEHVTKDSAKELQGLHPALRRKIMKHLDIFEKAWDKLSIDMQNDVEEEVDKYESNSSDEDIDNARRRGRRRRI